jgi:DNA-binding SARP family transcriptional activator
MVRSDVSLVRRYAGSITLEPPHGERELIDALGADLLTTWDDDWLRLERERLRQLRIHALESLAELLIRRGRHAEAIQAALTAIEAEPLRESAQITLIRAFIGEGNTSEAVRQYESFRSLLAAELGLRPSVRIQALLREHLGPRSPTHAAPAPPRGRPAPAAGMVSP